MRELKFRAWDGDTMYYDVVIGSLPHIGMMWADEFSEKDPMAVSPEWIMQYTCIKDHHGKEVYEKDIVEFDYFEIERRRAYVEWTGYCYGLEAFAGDDTDYAPLFTQYTNTLEVIGDIYKNPELLTKEGD